MVLTRPQARAAFTYILDTVLGKDDQSPLKKALLAEGYNDMFSLVTIDLETIESLTYDQSTTESGISIPKSDKEILITFLEYLNYRTKIGIQSMTNGYQSLKKNLIFIVRNLEKF